ncbi:MAG: hypothetical protein RL329_282 [Bacteroidota bacterium]|jgi:hypothetical protein
MAGYSSYSFKSVKKKFGLKTVRKPLFQSLQPVQPTELLLATLQRAAKMTIASEKSRSEWIVAPILMEVKYLNADKMNILSGENLDVDKEQSLTGECDFIFVRDPDMETVESPIFCLVEAEKNDITGGTGQCIAQMIGARMMNEQDGVHFPTIYGCVTTGSDWQFLKLEGQLVTLEENLKYINELPQLLGFFQQIVNAF